MRQRIKNWIPTIVATFIASTIAIAGTGNLPQVVTSIIQRAHVNDIRSALSGDLVPRDSSGTVNDNSSNLGQSTHRWATANATSFCIYYSSGGNPICFGAASAPGSGYTVTWPASVAASDKILYENNSGALGYVSVGSNLSFSGGTLALGLGSNIDLPGNLVTENGRGLVVNGGTNPSTSLAVVRGRINNTTIVAGEGFTLSHTVTGSFSMTFSSSYASSPTCVCTMEDSTSTQDWYCMVNTIDTSHVIINTVQITGSTTVTLTDKPFGFICMGPR